MLGTRIVVNEEKILKEGLYDLDEFYRVIDENAKLNNLIKTDKCTYMAKEEDQNDLPHLCSFTHMGLMKCDWFSDNLKEWWWIEHGVELDLICDIKKVNNHGKN